MGVFYTADFNQTNVNNFPVVVQCMNVLSQSFVETLVLPLLKKMSKTVMLYFNNTISCALG